MTTNLILELFALYLVSCVYVFYAFRAGQQRFQCRKYPSNTVFVFCPVVNSVTAVIITVLILFATVDYAINGEESND